MKIMKLILALALITPLFSCNSQTQTRDAVKKPLTVSNSDKIEAYYFHFTARCETCKTIEASTKENLETLYPNQVKAGLITFQSVNLDEKSSKPLAEKLGVSGQTLLLVKGARKVNLTNDGFLYAVVKPEKFREIINDKVAGLMVE